MNLGHSVLYIVLIRSAVEQYSSNGVTEQNLQKKNSVDLKTIPLNQKKNSGVKYMSKN